MDPIGKLLSHRARGFGAPEHSPEALRRALVAGVPYIEVDTRATADGVLLVHHDATLRTARGRLRLSTRTAASLADGNAPMTLADALRLFERHAQPAQRLCIDIKDYGFEEKHLAAVRAAGLEEQVVWVSWIPQTLARLHQLATKAPLFLSHTNLLQFPLLALLARPWRRSIRRWGPIVLQGDSLDGGPLEHWPHGYQHSLVSDTLPEPLIEVLARSNGGVCLHYLLGGARVAAFCQNHGLRLWLFTARDPRHFHRLAARSDVDVVFSNHARAVLDARA